MQTFSAIVLLLQIVPTTLAITTMHYFKVPSCNAGTSIGVYDNQATSTSNDTTCHAISATSAVEGIYIDRLDQGCSILTYPDTTCGTANPKLGNEGDCYYLDNFATLGSWMLVCGTQAAAASSSAAAGTATSASATAASTANSTASASSSATAKANAAGSFGSSIGQIMLGAVVAVVAAAAL